jgi:hypothetical protein
MQTQFGAVLFALFIAAHATAVIAVHVDAEDDTCHGTYARPQLPLGWWMRGRDKDGRRRNPARSARYWPAGRCRPHGCFHSSASPRREYHYGCRWSDQGSASATVLPISPLVFVNA